MMTLLSVNVSRPKEIHQNGKIITTGIFKESVPRRVMLRTLNLDGDGQADLNAHGGVHKAAYAYSIENYEYWKRELGRDDFTYGQFGENFTVEGMLEDVVHLGDVFRVGGAMVQISEPRAPCAKLALKMGLPQFPKRFLASERVGFYLRVLREGEVGAGDAIERLETEAERMTVRQFVHLAYFDEGNLEEVRRALRIPTLPPTGASGWRTCWRKPEQGRPRRATAAASVRAKRNLQFSLSQATGSANPRRSRLDSPDATDDDASDHAATIRGRAPIYHVIDVERRSPKYRNQECIAESGYRIHNWRRDRRQVLDPKLTQRIGANGTPWSGPRS